MGRSSAGGVPPSGRVAFAALRHRPFRAFFIVGMLSMMGDSIEHVISYWVLYQKFHSPVLAGYAVISHWAPSLFFGVYVGALADRFDCRRLLQVSQVLWMAVSLAWAALFITDAIEIWHAVVLLTVHGFASAINQPARQLIIHDIVGREHLQSAVRLSSMSIQGGLLLGPVVGGLFLWAFGETYGLVANAGVYLPMTIWLALVPYTGHLRDLAAGAPPAPRLGWRRAAGVARELAGNRVIITMVALGGLTSFFVGNGYAPNMPEFAHDLGADDGGVRYSILLLANAAGAIVGALGLESRGLLRAGPRTAMTFAMLWCVAIIGFAAAQAYWVALGCLFLAGTFNLTYTAMAQTLVQMEAPPEKRGRAVGLFSMAQAGLRVGSGFTIGVLGAAIGIHWSLGLSAALLLLCVAALFMVVARSRRPDVPAPARVAVGVVAERRH